MLVSNESGETYEFTVTRHAYRDEKGNRTVKNRMFTGTGWFRGAFREDGELGKRIEVRDLANPDSPVVHDADGKARRNVQIHIGGGTSEACPMIPGGGGPRDQVMAKIEQMLANDRKGGFSDRIYIHFDPAGGDAKIKLPEFP